MGALSPTLASLHKSQSIQEAEAPGRSPSPRFPTTGGAGEERLPKGTLLRHGQESRKVAQSPQLRASRAGKPNKDLACVGTCARVRGAPRKRNRLCWSRVGCLCRPLPGRGRGFPFRPVPNLRLRGRSPAPPRRGSQVHLGSPTAPTASPVLSVTRGQCRGRPTLLCLLLCGSEMSTLAPRWPPP